MLFFLSSLPNRLSTRPFAIQFIIDHYAGPVKYDTANFIDKNKDFVVPEHAVLLSGSQVGQHGRKKE